MQNEETIRTSKRTLLWYVAVAFIDWCADYTMYFDRYSIRRRRNTPSPDAT